MKPVSFGSLNLQQDPYRVHDIGDLLSAPNREILAEELARSDNAVAVYRKFTGRSYVLTGTVRDTTGALLEADIDQLKLRMMNQIEDVAVGWAGGYRYYRSECKNINIAMGATDITRAVWSAQMYMPKPFATDGTTANLITAVSGQTLGSSQTSTNNIGTYLALPVFVITFTAIEPNTSDVSITIGNPASSEYLTITETIADGDILTIDTVNQQLFLNSTLINPTGNFPAWAPGNGLLDYSDTGSSRTIDIAATYDPRYL